MDDLIERSAELDRIGAALADAEEGRGSLEFVSGPAGIGKTALLRTVGECAASRGFLVLKADGTELERDFPFGMVRGLYGRRLRDHPQGSYLEGECDRAALLAGR